MPLGGSNTWFVTGRTACREKWRRTSSVSFRATLGLAAALRQIAVPLKTVGRNSLILIAFECQHALELTSLERTSKLE
jgi:hypothetical protein